MRRKAGARLIRSAPGGGGGRRPATFRRILHPSDFSRASAKAFATALKLARAGRLPLTVAHVLAPFVPVAAADEGFILPETYERLDASARAAAHKQLDRLVARARRAGVRATGLLLDGAPHEQIVRAIKSSRADLVVIGTHGRTGLTRFFLGSVAARVVTLAPCPVLTVRGR
jgi:nucleotide-binding universal stress UspA family protein